MSLFKGSLRPPATLSDEAIERYLAAIRAEVEIDPLFRRRLRGQVVNRYVATRDGPDAGESSRHMGRLGRAVLYASFSLAVTVTSVMAASQAALPGEVLYPFKRQVERLRVQILPDPFHAELAAYALSERIGEMDRLADASDWDRVARLATVVEAGYAELLLTMDSDGADVALHQHFVVLNGLLDRLPEGARSAIQSAIDRAAEPGTGSPRYDTSSTGATPAAGTASPKPTRSPKPEATPKADSMRDPEASPRAGDRVQPRPTPRETKAPQPDDQ